MRLPPSKIVEPSAPRVTMTAFARFDEFVLGDAGAVERHGPLVVVHDVDVRALEEREQARTVEVDQLLAGVDHGGNAALLQRGRVLAHRGVVVGADDRERDRFLHVLDAQRAGALHRARVERDDLVVVEIGGDEALGGVRVVEDADRVAADAVLVEPGGVGDEVAARGGEDQRIGAEQLQSVRDVAGAAAEELAHLGHVEAHREDVQLVGQDVVLEAIGKHHDAVDRERTSDQDRHADSLPSEAQPSANHERGGQSGRALRWGQHLARCAAICARCG